MQLNPDFLLPLLTNPMTHTYRPAIVIKAVESKITYMQSQHCVIIHM